MLQLVPSLLTRFQQKRNELPPTTTFSRVTSDHYSAPLHIIVHEELSIFFLYGTESTFTPSSPAHPLHLVRFHSFPNQGSRSRFFSVSNFYLVHIFSQIGILPSFELKVPSFSLPTKLSFAISVFRLRSCQEEGKVRPFLGLLQGNENEEEGGWWREWKA